MHVPTQRPVLKKLRAGTLQMHKDKESREARVLILRSLPSHWKRTLRMKLSFQNPCVLFDFKYDTLSRPAFHNSFFCRSPTQPLEVLFLSIYNYHDSASSRMYMQRAGGGPRGAGRLPE